MRSKKLFSLLNLAVLMALAVACGPAATPTPTASSAGTVATATEVASQVTAGPTGTTAEKKNVKLTLNFLAGGPQAGFMYAKKLGYYDEAGLNVTIEEGQGSVTTAQMVATGGAQIGFTDGPSAMTVRSKGGKIKIVAPILQTNGFAIMSLKEKNITKVSDLIGKTISVQPGTAQTTLLDAIFAANGIGKDQVKVTNIDPSALVGSLLEGKVDAILAGADFQGVQIRDQGHEINELLYRDIGVPTVGLSIAVNDDLIKQDPDLIRRFVAASLKGWDAARANPEEAAQSVVEQFVSGNKQQILEQLKVDLSLLCAPGAKSLGLPPEGIWTKTYDLLTGYLGLPKDPPITDYYTTEFIPQDAPACP